MRRALAGLCLLALGLAPRPSRAQGVDWSRVTGVRPADEDPRALPRKSTKRRGGLFDASNTTVGLEVDGGPVWYRARGEPLRLGTVELGAGQTTTAATDHLHLTGSLRSVFRAFDSKTYLWTLVQLGYASGVQAGPLELEAQIGLGLLGVSAVHGEWSVDIFAPRAGLAVAAHMGRFRFAVGAHTEYLWRLFGMGYTAQGLTISFRFDLAPALPKLADTSGRSESP